MVEPTPYNPWDNIPEVALEGAKEARHMLNKKYHADGVKSMTSYLFSDFDGKFKESPTFFTCFGDLRSAPSGTPASFPAKPVAFFVTCFIRDLDSKFADYPEEENKFLEWLFNDSMFAEAFVTKSAQEARDLGVICNTHLPSSIVIQACTFARSVTHMARIAKMWDMLVQSGIEKHVAMLCAHQFTPVSLDNYEEVAPIMIDGGNSVFNSLRWFTDLGFRRFVNQDRSCWHGPAMFKQPGNYGWFLTQWNGEGIGKGNTLLTGSSYSPNQKPGDGGFNIMQRYDYTEGTAIPLQDAIEQCKMLQQKYIGKVEDAKAA